MQDRAEKKGNILMDHIDDDTLLKTALEILDQAEEASVRDHLSRCASCSRRLSQLQRDIGELGAVGFPTMKAPLRQKGKTVLSLRVLRAAAVLAAGFLAGYVTAEIANPGEPIVVAQNFVPAPEGLAPMQNVPCKEVDIGY